MKLSWKTVVTAQSASVYVSMQPLSWVDHVTLRRGAALNTTHKHTHTELIRPRQTAFYGLATNSVHAIHITHQTSARTHTLIWIVCVCRVKRACVFFPVQAQSDLSQPTGAWFVLGTACWVTTPPDRWEHNENRKPILRWQKKQGEIACVVLQPQWH